MRALSLFSILFIALMCFPQPARAVLGIGVTNKTGQCAELVYYYERNATRLEPGQRYGPYRAPNVRPGAYSDVRISTANQLAEIMVKMWPTADCSGSLNPPSYA